MTLSRRYSPPPPTHRHRSPRVHAGQVAGTAGSQSVFAAVGALSAPIAALTGHSSAQAMSTWNAGRRFMAGFLQIGRASSVQEFATDRRSELQAVRPDIGMQAGGPQPVAAPDHDHPDFGIEAFLQQIRVAGGGPDMPRRPPGP